MENKKEEDEASQNNVTNLPISNITSNSETDVIDSLSKIDESSSTECVQNKDVEEIVEKEIDSKLCEKTVPENKTLDDIKSPSDQLESEKPQLENENVESNLTEVDNSNISKSLENMESKSDSEDINDLNKSESQHQSTKQIANESYLEEVDNSKEPQVKHTENTETEPHLDEANPNNSKSTETSLECKENESILEENVNSTETESTEKSLKGIEKEQNLERKIDESNKQIQIPELSHIPNSSTDTQIDTKNNTEDTCETMDTSSTIESVNVSETVEDDPNISENHFVECETYNNLEEVDADIEKHLEQDVLASNEDQKKETENEQTEFVQVNPEIAKDNEDSVDVNKDIMEVDPIASDNCIQLNEDNEETHDVQGSNEELCIIPDTERVISQEEKEAASALPPLRDITETTTEPIEETSKDETNSSCPIIVHKYDKDDLQFCSLPNCTVQKKVDYCYNNKEGVLCYICDETCLKVFKSSSKDIVKIGWEDGNLRVKSFSICKESRICKTCNKTTEDLETTLTWEIMDFCNELCLTKYQKEIGSNCSSCKKQVNSSALGKYCVRFGNDIRQFCSGLCLEEYKKDLKVCSYCQQDISTGSVGFLAPVGDKGQFKDFCSQNCMEKYDIMTNNRPPTVETGTTCNVCKIEDKKITIEYEYNSSKYYFCSEPCFVAFCFVNNIETGKCNMCKRNFNRTKLKENIMYYDNIPYNFCSNSCQNIYIIAHRKIVPCSWCKVKKYNFDMIRRYNKNDGLQINMCSVNCLTLYQVSINAATNKKTICDYCKNKALVTYSLTMSDATIRNFCSYSCVMDFQGRFTKPPITLNMDEPIPTGNPQRIKRIEKETTIDSDFSTLPVITNVQSLAANGDNHSPVSHVSTRKKPSQQLLNETLQIQVRQHYIVRSAPLPDQRNVGTMCSVKKAHKSFIVKPTMVNKECQTEEREADKILIPVPIPIYVPTPLHMFSAPVPFPVPFPIPVPVPIFIPTTRNSANGILKEIKKIQVKIPTDPYEAELLMMAEMVAGDKKEENNTDSESDIDGDGGGGDDGNFSPEPDATNTFGDDMLQMALKMATEMDEPAVDLEGALTASTITAQQGAEGHEQNVDNNSQQLHLLDRQPMRGRKRGIRQSRGGGGKRGRRSHNVDVPMISQPHPQQPQPNPPEPIEKPDANMCLKYTFGVNAWKQWVTTKNAELEKSSRRVKLFKTEILQLTADELNYSLCLFVKEVRKPNGAEYAPDTIYYLCLGIQQYLFENGRIDNIFCDPYYEKFTDCLDEVARKFSILYNDSHYIVTRVEEEHLWESKQLGAHSPHVLLSTLMFFNTKHFNLTSVDEHMQLSFSHIMKHWKRNPNQPGASKLPGSRNVLLRFYPPQSAIQNNARKKKVYEQQENEENPLRCPVKLYEFYLSKCPESVKTRNDVFYLQPERSCVPDSPVWYSTMPLARVSLEKMLHRVKMVKEINVALLTS